MSRSLALCLATLAALLLSASPVGAQDPVAAPTPEPTVVPAPATDAREAAAALPLGSPLRGDTAGSTVEPAEPPPTCAAGATGGSVWYALSPPAAARDLVIELDAGGDLDAVVDVVRRERSQLFPADCGVTDRTGRVTLDLSQQPGTELYVRVSPLANSAPGTFTLRAVAPDAPERPPGRQLPADGATGTLDRVANPDDAYAVSLRAGRSYRLRLLSERGCVGATLYRAGATSFVPAERVRSLSCDDYALFTPGAGEGGRFALQVLAPRNRRGALPYRLAVARVSPDDTAPGLELPNGRRRSGALLGSRTDVVDLYRFAVRRRSVLDVRLGAADAARFDLRLVGAGGKRLACACGGAGDQRLRRKLRAGRYFVAVRSRSGSDGRYELRRLARTITRLRVRVPRRVAEGASVPVSATVGPGAAGPVAYRIERFDPLAGWQYVRTLRDRAVAGRSAVSLDPPVVGRWRVRATFEGSRRFAPAPERITTFTVVEPAAADD